MKLDIETLTGGAAAILAEVIETPELDGLSEVPVAIGMAAAGAAARRNALRKAANTLFPVLAGEWMLFTSINGQHADAPTREAKGDYEAAMADMIEKVLEPFAESLSGDWITNAADTRLYEENALTQLSASFAEEVWKQATWRRGAEVDGEYKEGGPLSQNQILSRIGIVPDTMEAALAERNKRSPEQKEANRMSAISETRSRLSRGIANAGYTLALLCDELDEATDTDAGVAQNAIGRLGGTSVDCATLRGLKELRSITRSDQWVPFAEEIMKEAQNAGSPAPEVPAAPAAPSLPASAVQPPPAATLAVPSIPAPPALPPVAGDGVAGGAVEEDPLAAFFAPLPGGQSGVESALAAVEAWRADNPALVAAAAPLSTPTLATAERAVSPPAIPMVETPPAVPAPPPGAPTAAEKPKRSRSKGEAPANAIPAIVLEAIAGTVAIKNEELASGVGVSRATWDNYCKGKAFLVPEAKHIDFLLNVIDTAAENLAKAREKLLASQPASDAAA